MAPNGWRTATLSEIVQPRGLQTGPFGSQLKASEYTTKGVPVVMPKDLRRGHIDPSSIARVPSVASERLARHRVVAGDVLFGRRGEIGRCAVVTAAEDGWLCGTGCLRARPKPEVDSDFLIQQLLSRPVTAWLVEHAVGQTMLNLSAEILARLPIKLPPLIEQRKIAAILSTVDAVVQKTEAVIRQIQVVKKAMMRELLTRGLSGRHTRFRSTQIGEIPYTWGLLSLEAAG
jgi:type I restriction enzyme, S subunit